MRVQAIEDLCVNQANPPLSFIFWSADGRILSHIPSREATPILFVLARLLQYGPDFCEAAETAIDSLQLPMKEDLPQLQALFEQIEKLHDCEECIKKWELDRHILDECDDADAKDLLIGKYMQLKAQLESYGHANYSGLFPASMKITNHRHIVSELGKVLLKLDEHIEWIFLYGWEPGNVEYMGKGGTSPLHKFCKEKCENE